MTIKSWIKSKKSKMRNIKEEEKNTAYMKGLSE